jgi:hypothetical protein
MANNYTQFSAELLLSEDPVKREEEKAWLRSVLEWEPGDGELKDLGVLDVEDEEHFPDFDAQLGAERVWFYAEEAGNLDNLASVVQAYLVKFCPKGCWGITWADTCSRPRVGEFGGGAVFVTATERRWMSTYSWVAKQREEFEHVSPL